MGISGQSAPARESSYVSAISKCNKNSRDHKFQPAVLLPRIRREEFGLALTLGTWICFATVF